MGGNSIIYMNLRDFLQKSSLGLAMLGVSGLVLRSDARPTPRSLDADEAKETFASFGGSFYRKRNKARFFINSLKLKNHLMTSLLFISLFSATVFGFNNSIPPNELINTITANELKMHIDFLASDELGGRFTFNPSSYIAARYLSSRLKSYGFRGAARDKTFYQRVLFTTLELNKENYRANLISDGKELKLNYAEDFIFYTTGDRTTLKINGDDLRAKLSGSLVFVGYGISSPRNNYDDYAGLDVKGKIVVRVNNKPESLKDVKLQDDEQKDGAAAKHGATGAIVISTGLQKIWDGYRETLLNEKERRLRPKPDILERRVQETNDPLIPEILAGPPFVKALTKILGEKENYLNEADGESVLRPRKMNANIDLDMGFTLEEAPSAYNVAGILEGSDPKLKDEYVVLTAHYDTLGSEEKQFENLIHNGADDNASGTAAILEIAEAFANGKRPKRSLLIVFYTAEELGLFGSQFHTDYETLVPLEKIAVNINLDMIGRSAKEGESYKRPPFGDETSDKDSVFVINNEEFSDLKKLHEEINQKTVRLKFDYKYSDKNAPSRMYFRTDSYNFAKHGVPFITYFTGLHKDYHTPRDDLTELDFKKMEKIARLAFSTSWQIAESKSSFLRIDK